VGTSPEGLRNTGLDSFIPDLLGAAKNPPGAFRLSDNSGDHRDSSSLLPAGPLAPRTPTTPQHFLTRGTERPSWKDRGSGERHEDGVQLSTFNSQPSKRQTFNNWSRSFGRQPYPSRLWTLKDLTGLYDDQAESVPSPSGRAWWSRVRRAPRIDSVVERRWSQEAHHPLTGWSLDHV